MKKGLFILFLFTILFNLIFSTPTFTFERKLFVANGENEITSITSSEDDIYLFMKKDDNDYIFILLKSIFSSFAFSILKDKISLI